MPIKSSRDVLQMLHDFRVKGDVVAIRDFKEKAFLKFNIVTEKELRSFAGYLVGLGYLSEVFEPTKTGFPVREHVGYKILLEENDHRFEMMDEPEMPTAVVKGRTLCENLILKKGLKIRYIGRSALMVAKDLIVADDIAKERGGSVLTPEERQTVARMFRL